MLFLFDTFVFKRTKWGTTISNKPKLASSILTLCDRPFSHNIHHPTAELKLHRHGQNLGMVPSNIVEG
jgi:hypothetical protein